MARRCKTQLDVTAQSSHGAAVHQCTVHIPNNHPVWRIAEGFPTQQKIRVSPACWVPSFPAMIGRPDLQGTCLKSSMGFYFDRIILRLTRTDQRAPCAQTLYYFSLSCCQKLMIGSIFNQSLKHSEAVAGPFAPQYSLVDVQARQGLTPT